MGSAITGKAGRARTVCKLGIVGSGRVDASVQWPSKCLAIESFFNGISIVIPLTINRFFLVYITDLYLRYPNLPDKRGYIQKKAPFSYVYGKEGALQVQDELGYTYAKRFYESKNDSTSYWICRKRRTELKCPVNICVVGDFIVKQLYLHNHGPEIDHLEEPQAPLEPIIELSVNPLVSPNETGPKKPNILKRNKRK